MVDTRDIRNICLYCFGDLDPRTRVCTVCNKHATDELTPMDALPLRTLIAGRYLIGAPLGRGGFGITYNAYDTVMSVRVAIKEFFPKGYTKRRPGAYAVDVADENCRNNFNYWMNAFVQEAKVLTSIKHMDGIVGIRDFFLTNNTAYIVMEYLDGMSLHKLISLKGERLQLDETLKLMRPVLDTLLLLHKNGVIHKDISPENIQIIDDNTIKLIDFGAASIYTSNVAKPFFVLKKGFSPIELYSKSGSQGPWTDIYEVGATIYNCLVGTPPPEANTRTVKDKLVPPSELNVLIPPSIEQALLKSLSVYPNARYSDIGEFRQMLYGALPE